MSSADVPAPRAFRRPSVDSVVLVAASALFILATMNVSLWTHLLGFLGGGAAPLLTFGLAAFAATLLLIAPFDFGPTLKPALALLFLIGAATSYYVDAFGVVIDHEMIRNVVQTDAAEAGRLLTPAFAGRLVVFGLLPALALMLVRVRRRPLAERALGAGALLGVALLTVAGSVAADFRTYASVWRAHHVDLVGRLNPLGAVLGTIDLAVRMSGEQTVAVQPLGADAHVAATPSGRKRVLALVIGETARAQNFSLNGYARETSPELEARGVLNFRQVTSCGTATAVSLPCMFSPFGRAHYSAGKAAASENLTDVLRHAGLSVSWWDNNSGSKGVAARISYDSVSKDKDDRFCRDGECDDGVLIDRLATQLKDVAADTVIVLHTVGSHGPAYFSRYPQDRAVFKPDCRTAQLSDCSRAEIVNAYDNTILQTDHVLAQAIDLLAKRADLDTAMVYVSDHGESLGEMGLYLHGMPYAIAPKTQTHVPLVAWLSAGFAADAGLDLACLAAARDTPLSHDNLFDTTLGLMGVETAVYRRPLDAFAACRTADEPKLSQSSAAATKTTEPVVLRDAVTPPAPPRS